MLVENRNFTTETQCVIGATKRHVSLTELSEGGSGKSDQRYLLSALPAYRQAGVNLSEALNHMGYRAKRARDHDDFA
jgi:hypothetical protein